MFLVLADQALLISPLKYQIHGILGVPAVRALEALELSAEGTLTLTRDAKLTRLAPNLFFDGLNPIVQVVHLGHNLQMMLDTGARTSLYPSMREVLAQWERDELASAKG